MENFNAARADEPVQYAGLQAEWLESQKTPIAFNKTEIATAQAGGDPSGGPGKDVADRLDSELRSFANSKPSNPDDHIVAFQKMVGGFCDNPNKLEAMQQLGEDSSKLRVTTLNEAQSLSNQVDATIAQNPAEQAQIASFDAASNQFTGAVEALPFEQNSKITDLMGWQGGENKAEHDARVEAGLKDDPSLLASFKQMATAENQVESSKSPKQKALEAQINQDDNDLAVINSVVNKAYIRSQIP